MKRILIFVDWFVPGYKAGGQISSCANIAAALQNEMDIYIVTRDRDMNDTIPYAGIKTDSWVSFDARVKINYVSPPRTGYKNIQRLIKEVDPAVIYINSMFSYRFTLIPLLAVKAMRSTNKLVLAPRGMLQAGALQFKTVKKKAVLALLYHFGLIKNVLFHATDETEEQDIRRNIKGGPRIQLVYDFPATQQEPLSTIDKQPGYLECLFVSRITGKKNLHYLLQVMKQTKKNISLTIAGPVEDNAYWEDCLQEAKNLPRNCSIHYIGAVPNNLLPAIYRQHHLFVLPTLGENFGHVIFDAFINGRPVLISNKTPWCQLLDQNIGIDVDLAHTGLFAEALNFFADMAFTEWETWCSNAWLFAQKHIEKAKNLKEDYTSLFN